MEQGKDWLMVVIEVVWEGFRSGVNVFVPTIFKLFLHTHTHTKTIFKLASVDSEVHGKNYIENEIHIKKKIY